MPRSRTRVSLGIEQRWVRNDPPPNHPATEEEFADFSWIEFDHYGLAKVENDFADEWIEWANAFERERAKAFKTAGVRR